MFEEFEKTVNETKKGIEELKENVDRSNKLLSRLSLQVEVKAKEDTDWFVGFNICFLVLLGLIIINLALNITIAIHVFKVK